MENKKANTENKERNLYCTGIFSQFTYWNYDRIPSKNDTLAAALDWVDIAKVVSCFTFISYNALFINIVLISFSNDF